MKKILSNVLALCCAGMVAWACSAETDGLPAAGNEDADVANVKLQLAIPTAAAHTKAVVNGLENQVDRMLLLCFSSNGMFISSAEATIGPAGSGPQARGTIEAQVPASTARVHFVANYNPATLKLQASDLGTDESALLRGPSIVSSSNSELAFWGYKRFDTSQEMKEWLGSEDVVYLLRDRARISLESVAGDAGIKAISWTLSNGLEKGYIAPYNKAASLDDPFSGYYSASPTPVATAGRMNEYAECGRLEAAESDMLDAYADGQVLDGSQLYAFEDINLAADPVKLIMKVTYSDDTVRYHSCLLLASDFKQNEINRNYDYHINVSHISKELGESTFAAALTTTNYSNGQFLAIDRVVGDVNNGEQRLVLNNAYTTKLFQTIENAVINFTYTDLASGMGVNDYQEGDLQAKWLEDDGVAADANTQPVVTYDKATGQGTISLNLTPISHNLQHGVLRLLNTRHGLTRNIDVYSIDHFNFEGTATLERVAAPTVHNGYPVYRLNIGLPTNYPDGLYPINVRMATNTLNAFSDDAPSATAGYFSTVVEDTRELTTSTNTLDWNFKASEWGYWYNYRIDNETKKEDGNYTFYFDDVRSKQGTPPSQVGIFVKINYFDQVLELSAN